VTREVPAEDLRAATFLSVAADVADIADCTFFVITVPTPIDASKRPDLGPLRRASQTVGSVLKKGDIVVFESTVFPGATEEECVPILEAQSGLRYNRDFFVG
jgi:UDP-N-acetyl-D-galactosamine dehydrogenase